MPDMDQDNDNDPRDGPPDVAALRWLVRLHGSASAEDRAAFAAWLQRPQNRDAFAAAEALWRKLDGPAAALAAKPAAHRPSRRWYVRAAAIAVVVIAAGAAGWLGVDPGIAGRLMADLATGKGERRSARLADGSAVELDADSAVWLDYSAEQRRVHLRRGAAFFRVSGELRPFVVQAGATRVTVLGTSFGVRRSGEDVSVAVEHGRVTVAGPGGTVVLGTAQALPVTHGALRAVPADLEAALGWRDGRLVLHQATLAEVAGALERYASGRILVPSRTLAERRISGAFRTDDVEQALDAIAATLELRRIRLGPLLTILVAH
jgi:transmembrane sensor